MDALGSTALYEFGEFRLGRDAGLLRRDASGWRSVPLGSRACEILQLLVERPGQLLSKREMMDLVWPGIAVEEHNLTVQISALRRVVDESRATKSCIENVPGRGYRFTAPVRLVSNDEGQAPSVAAETTRTKPKRAHLALLATACFLLAAAAIVWGGGMGRQAAQPNLSLAIPAFTALDNDAVHREMGEAIANDLRTDLANPGSVFIWLGGTIQAAPARPKLPSARYALGGSLRQFEDHLRVTAELRATDTGATLWADRFDVDSAPAPAQEAIVRRLRWHVASVLVAEEASRSARERPGSASLSDLLLQAYALTILPPTIERWDNAASLFRRALKLDPNSIRALTGLAYIQMDAINSLNQPATPEVLASSEQLVARAESLAPGDAQVMFNRAYLLRTELRWEEASAAYQALLEKHSDITGAGFAIGMCLLQSGKPAEAIPWVERAIRADPEHPSLSARYSRLGQATLLVGRLDEAIASYEQALATNPGADRATRISRYLSLAAAHMLRGEPGPAEAALAQARALDPTFTAEQYWPPRAAVPGYEARIDRLRAVLREAGLPGRSETP